MSHKIARARRFARKIRALQIASIMRDRVPDGIPYVASRVTREDIRIKIAFICAHYVCTYTRTSVKTFTGVFHRVENSRGKFLPPTSSRTVDRFRSISFACVELMTKQISVVFQTQMGIVAEDSSLRDH